MQLGVPRDSLQPCTLREDEALWIEAVGSDGTEAFEGLVNFVPEVIALNELAVEAIASGREQITDEAVERWTPVFDAEAAFA